MDENIQNFNFVKETVEKYKNEIEKLLVNQNSNNSNIIQLKKNIDEIEKDITSQEKYLVSNFLSQKNNKNIVRSVPKLPYINTNQHKAPDEDFYSFINYQKRDPLQGMRNYKKNNDFIEEKKNFINNMLRRKPRTIAEYENLHRIEVFKQNQMKEKILKKYGIKNDNLNNEESIIIKRPNFMDPSKRIQYSSSLQKSLRNNNNIISYDKYKNPIIKKEELDKGLLYLIQRGLIPKGADLSPAFENNGGNPLKINQDIEEKEEESNDYKYEILEEDNNKYIEDNLFITKADGAHKISSNEISKSNLKDNYEEYIEKEKLIVEKNKNQKRKTIMFSNFAVVENDEYRTFYMNNIDKWGSIYYLFEHLGKLFKNLNLMLVEVYQDKILELAQDEMRHINNSDLLKCVCEKDLLAKNIIPTKKYKFYNSNKEKFVVRIQKFWRKIQAKKKLKEMQSYFEKIKLIQHVYRSSKLLINSRKKAKKLFEQKYNDWKNMMENFKKKWELIKGMKRIEIHFNNISINQSNSLFMNTTFNNFNEKENMELNRLVNLQDNNVEIIYISPVNLSKEIISYYTSILNIVGIDNINSRLHIIVPDQINNLSDKYSISEKLLLSPNTINKIKEIIGEKEAYIVPGNYGKSEMEISILLNVPILMGDLFQSQGIFTKSGSKLVFEANELNVPISAWDIKTEYEFYASLSHLIITYPNYNIWVFKMDNEINGRGIAYIHLDKIQPLVELKKKINTMSIKKYEELLCECLKNNISQKIKICADYLYKSWENYLFNFLKYRGIIEACPCYNPSNIVGSPCLPILIEPDGNIEYLPTYDKINLFSFRNIGAISPSDTLNNINNNNNKDNNETNNENEISSIKKIDNNNNLTLTNNENNLSNFDVKDISTKIGKYLYEHNIIGYVTIELILFKTYNNTGSNNNINYWAIDLKFGLNELISSIQFCNYLYCHAQDRIQENELNKINISLNQGKFWKGNNCKIFTFPFLAHPKISEIKMSSLTKEFRKENLIFDLEKKKGIVFNLSNVLECGSLGICGILNLDDVEITNDYLELWKLISNSLYIIGIAVRLNDFQPLMVEEQRTDLIDIADIFNKINKFYNNLLIYEKRDKKK